MKKFIIFVVIYSTVIFFVYISFFQKTIINNTLSERAKEYIRGQKNKQTEFGKDVNLDIISPTNIIKKEEKFDGNIMTDCYQFTLNLKPEKIEKIDTCSLRIYLRKPRLYITVSYRNTDVKNINELSDIILRSSKQEEYTRSSRKYNNTNYVIFQKKTIEYEKTAFTLLSGTSVSISVIGISNENLDNIFDSVLSSMKYL